MEIAISKIEKKTKVPRKFRFPMFSKLLWYTANDLLQRRDHVEFVNKIKNDETELRGLSDLAEYIHTEALVAAGQVTTASAMEVKAAKNSIIGPLRDAVLFAKVFGSWVSTISNHKYPLEWAVMSAEEQKEALLRDLCGKKQINKRRRSPTDSVEKDIGIDVDHLRDSPNSPRSLSDKKVEPTVEDSASQQLKIEKGDLLSKAEANDYGDAQVVTAIVTEIKSETQQTATPSPEDKQSEPESSVVSQQETSKIISRLSPTPGMDEGDDLVSSESKGSELSPPPPTDELLSEEMEEVGHVNNIKSEADSESQATSGLAEAEEDEQALATEQSDNDTDAAYDSDAVSETSTVIQEDVIQSITSEEGKHKNHKIYQELMDLYSSRTRHSMQILQNSSRSTTNGSSSVARKRRRNSAPTKRKYQDDDDIDDEDVKPSRSRRKSTPGGKKSARSLRDCSNSSPLRFVATEKAEKVVAESVVKRGRGRPRGPNSKLYAMEERERKRQEKLSSNKASDSSFSSSRELSNKRQSKSAAGQPTETDEETLQRLIREAQLGIRSRR